MERVAARCAVALLGLVALFQIALVAGAPWGAFTQGGQTSGTLPLAGRLLAIVANTASQSASERMLWAPFSLVLAIVIGFVMWRTRRGEVVHASNVD
ncbi:MAG: hypothetical protein NTZ03_10985 [Actinobacteria bacterium]|nr:hypothetical protein [Actinomycetota bacterium]